MLIRTCSILDSFFKRALFSPKLDKATDIKMYRAYDDKNINMGTHRVVFDPFYQLSSKKIYELRTFEPITPFSNWSSNKKLDWWEAYNHVKHDRFKNQKEATFQSTLNALGGLFILNVIHLETMPVLVDYDIIKSYLAKGTIKSVLEMKEPLKRLDTVYAKTKLFGYVFDSGYEPDYEHILSRSYPGY